MKSEWKECTLGDITSLVIDHRRLTPKKLGGDWAKEGYRALSAKNVKTGRIVQSESIKYVSEDMYRKWMPEEIEYGDILITSEAPFGEIYQWNSSEKIVLSQRLFGLRISSELNANYIYYYMTTEAFKGEMKARATGTTVIGLRQPELLKCKIRLPNLQTQNKIASVLRSIDDKIELNTNINENLLLQAQTVFDKYYNISVKKQSFTSLIDVLGGGTPKTSKPDFWGGSIPFFTPKDIGVPYTFLTEKYITESGLNNCNSRLYPKNTTFVTARGTVGKVSLAGKPMAMNQSCYALVSHSIDPLLVYFYVLKAVKSLKNKASGAVFDAIVTRDFDTEVVNVLSEDNAQAVSTIISSMMEAIHNNTEENERLSMIRDTLLPKLMSDELDVSNIVI